jgi:hypothetical protein
MLVVHFIDVMWMVLPSLHREGNVVAWSDFAAAAGIGGLWLIGFAWALSKTALIPSYDPHADQLIASEAVEHA